jgi:phospholipid/cholesterol/gamma-HCH transport system substrate-binding protein
VSKSRTRWTVARLVGFAAIAIATTVLVATTLLDLHVGATHDYQAVLTNASGLQSGDTVRIAGVETGRVDSVRLVHGRAVISFSVDNGQELTTTTHADVHFLNLLGQRFLALDPGRTPGEPLRPGSTIPLSRTAPALDLTAVFDGFQPLFSALTPSQVNQLTSSLIQTLQGQGGNLDSLVTQIGTLTNNLAGRQVIIDRVVDNLSQLLDSVGSHDRQLGQLIDSFTGVVKGLASERPQIASTIDGVRSLSSGVSNVLSQSQPDLNESISGLAGVSRTLAADQSSLDGAIGGFPAFIGTLTRVLSSGSYLSIYVCNLTLHVQGSLNISLIPGVPAPQAGDPVSIPSGAVGDQGQHTANCT